MIQWSSQTHRPEISSPPILCSAPSPIFVALPPLDRASFSPLSAILGSFPLDILSFTFQFFNCFNQINYWCFFCCCCCCCEISLFYWILLVMLRCWNFESIGSITVGLHTNCNVLFDYERLDKLLSVYIQIALCWLEFWSVGYMTVNLWTNCIGCEVFDRN